MTPYETIRLLGAQLHNGQTERTICPWCRGGRTYEESFIVTRQGPSIKYYCHRASCDGKSSGVLSLSGNPTQMSAYKKKPRSRQFTGKTMNITTKVAEYLFRKYQLTRMMAQEYNLRQDEERRIVIPIYNSGGIQQGLEVKRGLKETGPKSLLYHGDRSDGMNWFTGKPSYPHPRVTAIELRKYYPKSCILVEDSISAMKANAFMNAISLHGVNLAPGQAQAIADKGWKSVFIALDADAKGVAIQLAKRYRAIIPNLNIILLSKDIKDMDWDAIASTFSLHHKKVQIS